MSDFGGGQAASKGWFPPRGLTTGWATGRNVSSYARFFIAALDKHLQGGRIRVVTPGGATVGGRALGPSRGEAPEFTLRVHKLDFFRKVVCQGNLGMGEAYMAGDFEVADGLLAECLTLLLRSELDRRLAGDAGFALRYLGVRLVNVLSSKAANVQRHYDIGEDLFDSFLEDPYQVYSCGYAHSLDDDAETLQRNKLDRICRKLGLQAGQRLLDIGCGKGGLLIHAALNYGVSGVGVTNSRAHRDCALANIRKFGLQDRLTVQLGDFSSVDNGFDRVASVGMLEHVPPREVAAYFRKIAGVLRPGGWALVHCIGLNTSVNRHDPFIQKYIFPGSDTPKLSVLARNVEENNLAIIDVENIVRHYAVTCTRWLEAFRRNRGRLDPSRYDDSFKRMWEYYLCCGVAAALAGNLSVYQVLFTNDYHAAYPFQRT